ncbi:chloride channel protein [Sphingomonas naphthae]|uniref:Chloride channel protein n=1 Tax=Sphingomonas naphthae TaxID=1813468 RepID=A0ABY7TQ78_9SPHN|nr:chloride channel protein [Sphingomonas naphthae]WCT74787.1 chloride channel protein [Sphingomonas naphthae]
MSFLQLIGQRIAALRQRGAREVPGARDALTIARRRIATGAGAVLLALVAIGFAKAGDLAQHLFLQFDARWPLAALLLTPFVFAAVTWATRRFVPEARGSGIPQVMAASHDPADAAHGPLVSIRTAVAKFVMTLAILCAGGAAGREGPTVQISAAIMVAVHRLLRVPITAGVLIAGGAAGVAAAFNTPLAGVAFAIEELAAAYEQRVAVLVMAAVMVSGLVSLGIAGDYIYFGAMRATLDLGSVVMLAPVAGVVGGLAGGLFSRALLAFSAGRLGWIAALKRRPILLAAGCGLVVAVLGVVTAGATWGTGYGTTRQLVEGQGGALWFAPAKLAATLATALSGTPGGIFAPSLAVGAGIGHLVAAVFPNQPSGAIVLLGMIGYFVGVVRAPLTAVIIVIETTASRGLILPLFATALVADGASALVCRERLYHGLSRAFLRPDPRA